MAQTQKIAPCLWFDRNAEEAVNHYMPVFENARILKMSRYGDGAPLPKGTVLMIEFELAGQRFQALNGGPVFKFTEAVSMSVRCEDQSEVDKLWDKLSAGGTPGRCGWLKDKFGLSWQIVPSMLGEIMGGPDTAGAARAMAALMTMSKLDIAALKAAYAGTP